MVFISRLSLCVFLIISPAPVAYAISAEEEAALNQTQNLLRDPSATSKEASKTEEGRKAIEQMHLLGGSPENEQQMLNLSADIFADIVKESNGDTEKMKLLLDEARKNPAKFADKLSEKQKKDLNKISTQLPSN